MLKTLVAKGTIGRRVGGTHRETNSKQGVDLRPQVDTEWTDRVHHVQHIVEGGNDPIFTYNIHQVEDLMSRLDFEDLLPEELITIALALATAYGRKLSRPPGTTLSLVTDSPGHRMAAC